MSVRTILRCFRSWRAALTGHRYEHYIERYGSWRNPATWRLERSTDDDGDTELFIGALRIVRSPKD